MRYFIATCLFVSAFYSLSINKKTNFYLKSSISIFLHYSNIIILLIKPFLKIKWTAFRYTLTIIIFVLLAVLSKELIINYIEFTQFENPVLIKFKKYLLYYDDNYEYLSISHVFLKFLLQYTVVIFNIFIIFWSFNYKQLLKDEFYRLLLNSQIIGSIILLVFIIFDSNQMGIRLNFLLSIGSFLLIKEVLFKYYKGKYKTLIYVFVLLYLSFVIFVKVMYNVGIHNPESEFYIF